VRELERQMASLQRQAKRAEEYHRLKDELRTLDFRVMAARRRAWETDVADIETTLAAIQVDEHTLSEGVQRRQASTDAARGARLDEEQRALGLRLEANAREREAARVDLARLADERVRAAAERDALALERARQVADERAGADAVERARDAVMQLVSRAESLRE